MDIVQLPNTFSHFEGNKYFFREELFQAVIVNRPNRFIANIEINGMSAEAHCPVTGLIGGWILDGLNALVSKAKGDIKRRTKYTLEAIEVTLLNGTKQWIGINQSNANKYIEASIYCGHLDSILGPHSLISREKKLGNARIDFKIDHTYMEVKTPLKTINLQTTTPMKNSSAANISQTDRLVRHVEELTNAMKSGERAILLYCFIYDAPKFDPPRRKAYSEIQKALKRSRKTGLESWQTNYSIDSQGIELKEIIRLNL